MSWNKHKYLEVNPDNRNWISFSEVLTIVFIVLKLTGVVEWSWWWVLSPIWIHILIFIAVSLIIFAWYKFIKGGS